MTKEEKKLWLDTLQRIKDWEDTKFNLQRFIDKMTEKMRTEEINELTDNYIEWLEKLKETFNL